MRKILTGMLVLVLASCTKPIEVIPNIAVDATDDRKARQFVLAIRNDSDRALCVPEIEWPNAKGNFESNGTDAFVRIGDQRFYAPANNMGVCLAKNCSLKIPPGQRLKAKLSYEKFGIPAELNDAEKTVEFAIYGGYC